MVQGSYLPAAAATRLAFHTNATVLRYSYAGWHVLQGSYLPATAADDLHAMQEHAELKEAMGQLRLMFEEVGPCGWVVLLLERVDWLKEAVGSCGGCTNRVGR